MWGSEGHCTIDNPGFVKRLSTRVRTADFDFSLPPEQVATAPAPRRDDARLMLLDRATGARKHAHFRDLGRHLAPRSLIVLNDTRVIAARLRTRKHSGGA